MWKMKTVGFGILIAWLSAWAIFGMEAFCYAFCYVTGFVALCGGLAAGLTWLKNVDSRKFYRRLTLAVTLVCVSSQSTAMAQMGTPGNLVNALNGALGLLMLLAIPTGIVMIIRGIMMDRHDGAWKWEILKGIALAAAPVIMNVIFNAFGFTQTLTPTFNPN
jgi:hypothetical protein